MIEDGWRNYPLNLAQATSDRWMYDLESTNQRLRDDAALLFSPSEETYIQAIEYGRTGLMLIRVRTILMNR